MDFEVSKTIADDLTGVPEAIELIFPRTQVQLCIVHKVRNSLHYVLWKERKNVVMGYAHSKLETSIKSICNFTRR